MNTYIAFVEFYGKKLKISVVAESASKTRKVIADNLIFHKIVKDDPITSDEILKNFTDIFGMFGMK